MKYRVKWPLFISNVVAFSFLLNYLLDMEENRGRRLLLIIACSIIFGTYLYIFNMVVSYIELRMKSMKDPEEDADNDDADV